MVSATPIRRQVPVTDYLRLQARYAHLFRPEERTDVIARIQASADRNVSQFGLLQDYPERTRPSLPGEGVTMRWLSTVAHADDGKLVIEKMRLDETGFPQPTGEFEELTADCLVLALGQDADLAERDGVPGVTFSGGAHPRRLRRA